ncbi:tripartite tricarboxylate transporter TctB family protein [Nitratireductor sp. ZSWI3]|uniref:tripartite tricarboxylate transporter TctB family protein n=1 Tax=Nitratireductor sp. ZSWI3 TaxID=2966359 RepID=UPI00214FA348|nr:tripartite tricarboxylate transporter TctB family protein [Nitratireductor sp. ZSWI3]MCR4268325.1 tripartite tricarboxylate transporter TctB family protein [Nitratireductor sp. ZSWI3]
MATADRISAVVFCALGVAMLVGGYTMDRLEIRQIHPLSIPGLLPMLLGGALALCGGLLWLQADPGSEAGSERLMQGGSFSRLALTAGLACFYALVLVGWLPFFWSTALFVSCFTAVFSWPGAAGGAARLRVLAQSAVFGVISATAVTLLFEKAFLVRLP